MTPDRFHEWVQRIYATKTESELGLVELEVLLLEGEDDARHDLLGVIAMHRLAGMGIPD